MLRTKKYNANGFIITDVFIPDGITTPIIDSGIPVVSGKVIEVPDDIKNKLKINKTVEDDKKATNEPNIDVKKILIAVGIAVILVIIIKKI